jgi:hypothetical protein
LIAHFDDPRFESTTRTSPGAAPLVGSKGGKTPCLPTQRLNISQARGKNPASCSLDIRSSLFIGLRSE